MKPFLLSFICVCLLSSCAQLISYVGNQHQPVENPDVFVDPAAIKKPYAIVGRGYLNYPLGTFFNQYEEVQKEAVKLA